MTSWPIAHQTLLSTGILQTRTLQWVAMPSSRGSSQTRDRTQVSHITGGFFTAWATRKALECEFKSVFPNLTSLLLYQMLTVYEAFFYLWVMCDTMVEYWLCSLSGEISREAIIDQLYNKVPNQLCPKGMYQSWVSEKWAHRTGFNITQLMWLLRGKTEKPRVWRGRKGNREKEKTE